MSDRDDDIGDRLWALGRSPALLADPIVQAVALILLISLVFLLFPAIDLWFSGLFFDSDVGFPLGRLAAFTAIRSLSDFLVISTVVVLIAAVVWKLACPQRPTPIRPADIAFVLSSLAIGPGLIVNLVFKEYWGRPRPSMVDTFGGEAPFVNIWQISGHCLSNCSFVSGEAAAAIWLVAVALILPRRWRKPGIVVALVLAGLLSLNRIAFGRHFLSDVLLAWALTLLVIAVVHRLVVERPPAWLANDRLEAGLTRLGRRLRGMTPE